MNINHTRIVIVRMIFIVLTLTACGNFNRTPVPANPTDNLANEDIACIAPYFDPIAFLPDHDRIILRSDSGIMIFNLKTLKEEIVLESPLQVIKAAVSPDGEILAWALEDNNIELIELPSGKSLNKLAGHTGMVTAIKFPSTGNRLYTASHDNSVKVWDTVSVKLISEYYPGGGEVMGIGISPDDTKLVIVTLEGPQKLWDMTTNKLIGEVGSSGAFDGADAGFSTNGQIVGISLGGGQTSLWDIETGTQLWRGGNYALALSPDGNLMAYSDVDENGDNLVLIRSLDDQRHISTLKGHGSLIWKVFFSADSSRLVSADGKEIRMWQTNDGRLLHNLMSTCP
jgi:WD40 repeat protein